MIILQKYKFKTTVIHFTFFIHIEFVLITNIKIHMVL
jgi:hypothetical protein